MHGLSRRKWLVGAGLASLGSAGLWWALLSKKAGSTPLQPSLRWQFEPSERGAIVSSPGVLTNKVYVGAIHSTAFHNRGRVYCVDLQTGKQVWQFDDSGQMLHMFSSPTLHEDALYIGEGMHANFTCKLYCLDAQTGAKRWSFSAQGHIESSASVGEGVYFGAGDDGLYCLECETGQVRWHAPGPWHIDAKPALHEGFVYVGAGISRTLREPAALCFRADTGDLAWRVPSELPVWGSPIVVDDTIVFGLANGRLTTGPASPTAPAGGVLCLAARTGALRWRYDAGDAVFAQPVVVGDRILLCARNGVCTCLASQSGQVLWQATLSSPLLTKPTVLDEYVLICATGGVVHGLDLVTGVERFAYPLTKPGTQVKLYSSPCLEADTELASAQAPRVQHMLFGAEVVSAVRSSAVLYCLALTR